MARTASTDKADGHNGTLFLVPINELTSGQGLPVDKKACAKLAVLLLFGSLNDEPLRELEGNDASRRSCRVVVCGRRGLQVYRRDTENRRKFTTKAGLRDRFSTRCPSVQASDQD
jgi:hypothetical protein